MNTTRFVIKCGGSTLAALPDSFFSDIRKLQEEQVMPVIVHGGGPAISEALDRFGIETEFVGGLRKTSAEVLDVVEMVLAGSINKTVVRRIHAVGGKALGLSGIDGHLLDAVPVANADEIGFVGEVRSVNTALLERLIDTGYVPVIAPLGIDTAGQRYNINADTSAGAVASFLQAELMIFITDVPGILDGNKRRLSELTVAQVEAMIESGEIYGGMIPKVRAAIQCIQGRVRQVVIADGAEPEILSRIVSGDAAGTRIYKQ